MRRQNAAEGLSRGQQQFRVGTGLEILEVSVLAVFRPHSSKSQAAGRLRPGNSDKSPLFTRQVKDGEIHVAGGFGDTGCNRESV